MSESIKLLIVDDAADLRLLLGRTLRKAGYEVIEAGDGPEAFQAMASERPALVILDVSMPGMSGFDVVEQMRAGGLHQPVLMLTCLDDVDNRVRGLGSGADDYLSKVFDHRELIARVQALLRRAGPTDRPPILRLGATTVDLATKSAERDGVPLTLTKIEFEMLNCLARAAGRPVPKQDLLGKVWGYNSATNTRTLETHIWRLRKKICEPGTEPRWLVNRCGVGYALLCDTDAPTAEVAGARLATA